MFFFCSFIKYFLNKLDWIIYINDAYFASHEQENVIE